MRMDNFTWAFKGIDFQTNWRLECICRLWDYIDVCMLSHFISYALSMVWNQCIYSILILSYLASLKTKMIEMKANNIEHWTSHIYQMLDIPTSRHCQFNVVFIFSTWFFKIAQFTYDLTLWYFHIIMTTWIYLYE